MRRAAALLTLATLLAVPGAVQADPVTLAMTFTMREGIGDPADVFGVPMPPGSVFTGVFTYESSAPNVDPDPRFALYRTGTATLEGGTRTLQSNNFWTFVVDRGTEHPAFVDVFTAQGEILIPGFHQGTVFLHFVSPPTAISTNALPQTAEEFVTLFPSGRLFLYVNKIGGISPGFDTATHELQADITPAPTPEPSSMLLLGTGLVGILRGVKRRNLRNPLKQAP